MDVSTRLEAVEAARDVLRRFRQEHPDWQEDQTPLERIAHWLGCEVVTFHPDDYPAGTYGFLEPGEALIWLCRDLSSTFRRFTLAHELGHVVLHSHLPIGHDLPLEPRARFVFQDEAMQVSSADPCQTRDVNEETAGLLSQQSAEDFLGPGLAYDPRSRRELAANFFAAELLMPLERVWELYVVQGSAPDLLASRFGVSQAALFNRLAGLLTEQPEQNAPTSGEIQSTASDTLSQDEIVPPKPTGGRKAYDEFQQAAIETPTPALVIAGPGSGKTSTLIGRAEYLLREQGVYPEQILALTFSRKAAQEMQERLQHILAPGQPVPTISTFHAFCADLLRTHGQHVGLRQDFALVDDAEGYFLLRSLASHLPLNHYQNLFAPASPFKDFLKAISRAKDELITPARYRELAAQMHTQAGSDEERLTAERALEVAAVYDLYQQALTARGDSDFGGLLMLAVQLLSEHPAIYSEIIQRYQHILVDEFQDINRASGILLRLLAGERKQIWVVGDANQCQPAGTMIRLPDGSECRIENIQPDSEAVTYDRDSTMFVKKGKVTAVANRHYEGLLYTVKAGEKQSQCTDSHKWLVRWIDGGYDAWITYIMRQGNRYRVGQTKMFLRPTKRALEANHRKRSISNSIGDFGLASRARVERADAAWILCVHDSLADALVYEEIVSTRYGLPEIVFSQSSGVKFFTQEMIDHVFEALLPLEEAARRCLEDHGRKLEYPLYRREDLENMDGGQNGSRQRQGRTTVFETQACNLISRFMAIPVAPDQIHSKRDHNMRRVMMDSWQAIEVTTSPFSGMVYSLDIATYHKYVADGLVTCNSIYGFRGASPANIGQFRQDYPEAIILPLSRNYRSRPDIVHLADTFKNATLEQDARIGEVQTARATQDDPYITLAVATDETSELRELVRDIQRKLNQGYHYRDIVVLCRTRALVRKITRELARVGLPVGERAGMMEQEHTKNMLSLLLLIVNSSGMGILRAARLPAHQLEQADVEALLLEARAQQTSLLSLLLHGEVPPALSPAGTQAWARLATIVKNLLHHSNSVWSLLARYLLLETSLGRDLLLAGDNVQASMMREDYASLLQFAHTYDQRVQEELRQAADEARERGEEVPATPDLQTQIRGFLDYLQILLSLRQDAEGKREEGDAETEVEPELVRVMTVHASKGLEFPVVYLPGLARQRFPLGKRYNPVPPPSGMLPAESEGERAHESGEACLFYVATTRARDQLILSHSERYGKQKAQRSGYIDALIVGLPDERVQRIVWQNAAVEDDSPVDEDQDQVGNFSAQPSQNFIAAAQPAKLRPGQIEDYHTCPRRYLYGSIYGFQHDEQTFLPFWTASDATIKELLARAGGSEAEQDQRSAAEVFQHHWQAHGDEDGPFAQIYKRHGQEVAEKLQQNLSARQGDDWQLHRNLEVDLAGRKVEVTIDRIETPGEAGQPTKFVRTRYGKSKSKPTVGMRELFYVHASRQHHSSQSVLLQTHNLSTGETHDIKITTRKETGLVEDFERAAQGIEARDYTPRPDAYICSTCPFYLICPA